MCSYGWRAHLATRGRFCQDVVVEKPRKSYTLHMQKRTLYYVLGFIGLTVIVWLLYPTKHSTAPTLNTSATNQSAANINSTANTNTSSLNTIAFSTADLPERDPAFSFTMNLPLSWRAEYSTDAKAINMYDKSVTGTSLTTSQVFIRYYTASTMKKIVAVANTNEETMLNATFTAQKYERPAVTSAIPSGYPTWWKEQHKALEVQTGSTAPYTYYTFDFHPTLSWADISSLVASITF